ncbi:MAG: hypothetical protein H7Y42_10920 [Chitinophagaceae bacterium]|nr:hypothetical protein [Chitinophagaceae bacterium]
MSNEFSHLDIQDKLKAENDFLKMKLMLEKGAMFESGGDDDNEIPPDIENRFLNNIMEFERQFENPVYIKVFDKIGRPEDFPLVTTIADDEIDAAWKRLSNHLEKYSITLDVCSPNITNRELYRFTTEELFEYEMTDMSIPGMIQGFIYDEFHPDPVYDNTRIAADDCMRIILEKEPLEWMHHYREHNLRLNEHVFSTAQDLKNVINQFKIIYDDLVITDLEVKECKVEEKICSVTGRYSVVGVMSRLENTFEGEWKVILDQGSDPSYWYIREIDIEGIRF